MRYSFRGAYRFGFQIYRSNPKSSRKMETIKSKKAPPQIGENLPSQPSEMGDNK
jgi:hypothetical protein